MARSTGVFSPRMQQPTFSIPLEKKTPYLYAYPPITLSIDIGCIGCIKPVITRPTGVVQPPIGCTNAVKQGRFMKFKTNSQEKFIRETPYEDANEPLPESLFLGNLERF
jgi:hypothetical protein